MPKTVVVLGAGASAPGGCPVLSDFLKRARKLNDAHMLMNARESFMVVDSMMDKLHPVVANFGIDLNIESLLSLLDIIVASKTSTFVTVDEAMDARNHLVRLIVSVLESTQNFTWRDAPPNYTQRTREGCIPCPPTGYGELAASVERLTVNGLPSCTVVTFNYDLGLEFALNGFDYPGVSPYFENEMNVRVCKMHGSMNWYVKDGRVIYEPERTREWKNAFWTGVSSPWFPGDIVGKVLPPGERPFIVAPSHDKYESMGLLASARQAASEAIQGAELIVFCGYSLSPTDAWFRNLLAAYTPFTHRLRAIKVFDKSSKTHRRYKRFCGNVLGGRLDTIDGGIVEAAQYLQSIGQPGDDTF
jgi:hypothetical protein